MVKDGGFPLRGNGWQSYFEVKDFIKIMTEKLEKIETVKCDSCGGLGYNPFISINGGECSTCKGRGKLATKRGHQAALMVSYLLSVPASELKVGDVVRAKFRLSPRLTLTGWANITEIKREKTRVTYTVHHSKAGLAAFAVPADTLVRRQHNKEEKAEAFRRAIALQNTLTEGGCATRATYSLEPDYTAKHFGTLFLPHFNPTANAL